MIPTPMHCWHGCLLHFRRVDKEDEISCLINGCNFLLKNISDEAFVYQRHGTPEYKFQNADPNIFPYLLVNIGSGVSIMKVIFTRFMSYSCTF